MIHTSWSARRETRLGIDLGTANTLAVMRGAGVVFDQPTVCCFQAYDAVPRFVVAGTAAHDFIGKVSKPLKIVRPLRHGVLSDMMAARELFQLIRREVGQLPRFKRIRPHIGVPADATQSERRALATAATDAGFGTPFLIAEPLLAAIGVGLDIDQPRGRMIVDCGAGTTEVAVISLGGVCLSKSVRGGGDALDQALIDYFAAHHRFKIGSATAETFKKQLSEAFAARDPGAGVEVRGLDMTSGLPRVLHLPAGEFRPVWMKQVAQVVRIVRDALGETPPELSEGILEDGITLTGGGAMCALLAESIAAETGVPTHVAADSMLCVARGLEQLIQRERAGRTEEDAGPNPR
jgi:rod shape-determining protein MreB